MSEALARVYAIQQREISEKERKQQLQRAKQQRVIAAFNTSGLTDIFAEFRDVPLCPAVRQRAYKQTVGELAYGGQTPLNTRHSLSFVSINGTSNGSQWYCEENPDSGNMRYCYHDGLQTKVYNQPQGAWLDHFIAYIASAADPEVVARIAATPPTTTTAGAGRRQLQTI